MAAASVFGTGAAEAAAVGGTGGVGLVDDAGGALGERAGGDGDRQPRGAQAAPHPRQRPHG